MPESALVVAVPEVEAAVGEWRRRYDNADLGIPAHVTLLYPFVSADAVDQGLVAQLRKLFAVEPAFEVTFRRVARFEDVAWLAPEPDAPFRRLTELLVGRYPAYPPYEGIHDELIPHLTVAVGDAALQDRVDADITPQLPIAAGVQEALLLVEQAGGSWRTHSRFPLGQGTGRRGST